MKITLLELFHISIPFAKPYKLSKTYGTVEEAHAVIVKMHTDEGIIGLGEADPRNPFTDETPGSVMAVTREVIAPHIMGEDPNQIGILETTLDRCVSHNLTARGGINMALYDIIGKTNGIPVHKLLGGLRHEELPILWGVGSGTPEEDVAAIDELVEHGCDTVMIKMGALPIKNEIERLISAKEHYGDHINFFVDANQGWDVSEAVQFIDGISKHPPDLIEQPVKHWDLEGLKRIRAKSPSPLSADESLTTIQDAATLIRARAVDIFSIKVSKNGGLGKSKQIAMVADAFDLKCLMNSMLEFGITQAASLQLGCTLPNLMNTGHAYGSVIRMADDISDFGRNITGATVRVPSENGLGVSLDEDKLKKYTVDYVKIG